MITSLLLSIILTFSFSMRSAKESDNPFDYELKTRAEKENVFYIDIEKERENQIYFTNTEFMLQKQWKYFLLRGKSLDIQSKDINIKEINMLGRLDNYYLGVVNIWENNHPDIAIKFGVEYTKKINLFISQPKLKIKAFTLTSDFKRFDKEFTSQVNFNLFTFGKSLSFDLFMLANLYQYKSLDWFYKTGLEMKF